MKALTLSGIAGLVLIGTACSQTPAEDQSVETPTADVVQASADDEYSGFTLPSYGDDTAAADDGFNINIGGDETGAVNDGFVLPSDVETVPEFTVPESSAPLEVVEPAPEDDDIIRLGD